MLKIDYIYIAKFMQFKRKIPAFVFGVTIGLLIGVTFFIFKFDEYFNKIKLAGTHEIKIIEKPVKIDESKKNSEEKERFKINTKVSPYTNYKEIDSLIKDKVLDEITIAKEELISVKTIKVIDLDQLHKDTLSSALAGVSNNPNANLFIVEFKKTPLNSTGYRMSKNRIILYGFSDFTSLTIYKVDDSYYLKSQDQVYKVQVNAEFMPMERVINSELLTRIN